MQDGVRFVLRCTLDHGTGGPGGRPQAARNVHRLDRRARPASSRLRGRGQRRRRGAGRLLRPHRRDAARRRRGPGAGQRPRHPGGRAPGGAPPGGRGRADHAARGRQVRRQVLRGLRRPARRRRVRGERAVGAARGRDPPGRVRLAAVLRARRPDAARCSRGEPTDETGTTITFWPDGTIFETTDWSFETLSRRMQEMAFLNRDLAITLTDERTTRTTSGPATRRCSYQYEGGIADFVRYLNASKEPVHGSVIDFGEDGDGISVEIAMQWTGSYTESVHTFANTINTAEGGTHEEGFRAALTTIVNRYAREQKLLREKDDNLTGDDVREGLTAIVSVKLAEPQFEGQTKTKLGNTEAKSFVQKAVQRPPAGLVRPQPRRGQGHHQQGQPGGPGPDRRPPGARPDPAQVAAGARRRCRASWPTASPPTRRSPRSTWSRATRRAARPRAAGTRSSRPSCRSAARSSTWRSRGSTGC